MNWLMLATPANKNIQSSSFKTALDFNLQNVFNSAFLLFGFLFVREEILTLERYTSRTCEELCKKFN